MGRRNNIIETRPRETHFTWDERLRLEGHWMGTYGLVQDRSPTNLATLLSKDRSTIYAELRRGTVEHTQTDVTIKDVYNADRADKVARSHGQSKGPSLKIGKDHRLAGELSRLVRNEHYSPYAIIQHFEQQGWTWCTNFWGAGRASF